MRKYLEFYVSLFIPAVPSHISLNNPIINWEMRKKILTQAYLWVLILLYFLSIKLAPNLIIICTLLFFFMIFQIFKLRKLFKEMRIKTFKEYYKFQEFLLKNNLFVEKNDDFQSAILSFKEDNIFFEVIFYKMGDVFSSRLESLDLELKAFIGRELYKKLVTATSVTYIFKKQEAERDIIEKIPLEDENMSLKIFDDIVINLRKNFSTIISGVSGSGKSTLLYGFIGQYASKTIKGKHAKLYVHDSKMSDLFKHMVLADMPKNQFGTTVKDAFSMLTELLDELERRKNIYTNSSEFDTVAMDLDLNSDVLEPVLFVIDEYPSLLGLMDTKQRADWNKKLGNYLRLSRQLSMGAWLVLQQANADETTGISTGLREQLVNKIYTGSEITTQSAQMMFSRGVKELPKVMDKYGGILSIDSKEPVAFLSPSFAGDINEILHPVLVNASNNYKKFIKEC